jgi:hypothetical protein
MTGSDAQLVFQMRIYQWRDKIAAERDLIITRAFEVSDSFCHIWLLLQGFNKTIYTRELNNLVIV